MDLFAGAGGLGEGFHQAGFDIVCSIDSDPHCASTLKTRSEYRVLKAGGKLPDYAYYLKGDIDLPKTAASDNVLQLELNEESLDKQLGLISNCLVRNNVSQVDLIIGGPPCQAYSIAGRSRDPDRKKYDPRHHLFRIYLKLIEQLQPRLFVYENVPGLLSAASASGVILELLRQDLNGIQPSYFLIPPTQGEYVLFSADNHYDLSAFKFDTATFGVPQHRKRIILIGIRSDLADADKKYAVNFWSTLENTINSTVTVEEAISDLPPVYPDRGKALRGNDRHLSKGYIKEPNHYSKGLRWEDLGGVLNHRSRIHMEADLLRYNYFIRESLEQGRHITLRDVKAEKREDILPAHRKQDIFIDRFKVQLPNRPASTVTAHIAKDGHYYIHPDIKQCRSLTVREAARLQSFPDDYLFEGPRTEQFRQVGNAVPPVFARKIAEAVKEVLSGLP
ncbi:DNA cytosine methyltransferase [Candidatus Neomarinimicrobiota bacterium]